MNKSKQTEESHYGAAEREEFHLFLYDKKSKMPIVIENIGVTHPNPRYKMYREESDYFIFEYIVSGKGHLEVNGQEYTVQAGDVYILEPGQQHAYYADPQDPFEKIWINFFSDFFVEVFAKFDLTGKNYFPAASCLSYFEELRSLAEQSNYSDEICYQVCSVLFRIVCYLSDTTKPRAVASQKAREIKKLLDGSLFENLTIADLEQEVNLSKAQLIKEFKKYYNTTPYRYLLDEKIKMAKRLLVKTGLSVEEVSYKLAFVDPHYFSRVFKKKTGLAPLEYKKAKTATQP